MSGAALCDHGLQPLRDRRQLLLQLPEPGAEHRQRPAVSAVTSALRRPFPKKAISPTGAPGPRVTGSRPSRSTRPVPESIT
jgi:hypothetical protein